jgi:DNA mismatch repair protein MutS
VVGSVLFGEHAAPETAAEPDCFADLNLDQLAGAIAQSDVAVAAYFRHAPRDVGLVRFRQRVFQDLERPAVAGVAGGFTGAMARTRRRLGRLDRMAHPPQADRWFFDTVVDHVVAVTAFADGLAAAGPSSPGLCALRDDLAARVSDPGFVALAAQARWLKDRLREVRYDLLLREDKVSIAATGDEPADFADRVLALFHRFRDRASTGEPPQPRTDVPLDAVEAGVLDLVVRLHSRLFDELADFRRRHREFVADDLVRLDRELRFYLGYLSVLAPLRAAGLPTCYPAVSDTDKSLVARDVYDLALAVKLVADGHPVVGNDLHLHGGERVLVVSGPNQGGKTTLSRTFGQLHHLAALGCPVPGRAVRIFLPDRILTQYERAETTLASKLEDELLRMRALLDTATADSVIILNEVFTSTTAGDSLAISRTVLDELLRLDALCLWVSFLDELSRVGPKTVSMVSTVTDDDTVTRTYQVVRAPADGRAYAVTLARRHGLTYDQLVGRVHR